jgi:hypothetical protein
MNPMFFKVGKFCLALFTVLPALASFALDSQEIGRENAPKDQTIISLEEVMTREPADIAMALYSVHRNLFLALDPEKIAEKYIQAGLGSNAGSDAKLQNFLIRIDKLANLVVSSSKNATPDAAAETWMHVAAELLSRNDLFGYMSVYAGVSRLGYTDRSELPNVLISRIYVMEKKKRLKQGMIPTIVNEGGCLQGYVETVKYLATAEDKSKILSDLSKTSCKDFQNMKEALSKAPPIDAAKILDLADLQAFFMGL